MKKDIRFIGEEFQGAEQALGDFEHTLDSIVGDHAFAVFGETAMEATDIEIVPTILDSPLFAVGAWHQTGGSDFPARLYYHDLTLRLSMHKEDAFIVTDDHHEYRLTTRETLLLMALGGIATVNDLLVRNETED